MENKTSLLFKNNKINYNFIVLETFKVGIILFGSEVKSIREKNFTLQDSYCYIYNDEIFIKGFYVNNKTNNKLNHDPKRNKKLLLTKKEIKNIKEKINEKGLSLVLNSIFFTEYGLIKLEISLVKGKKLYDKRLSLKIKDIEKNIKKHL